MLDRLNKVVNIVKAGVLYLLIPFAFIAGVIYYLLTKKRILEDELRSKDRESLFKESEGEKKQIDSKSSDSIDEYQRARDAYLREHPEEM